MKQEHLVISVLLSVLGSCLCQANQIAVSPEDCRIVIPAGADDSKQAAAQELRMHLFLITGVEIPIADSVATRGNEYAFFIGERFPQDHRPLAPEEARWRVTPTATYFFGDDDKGHGTQSAIYGFLEDQIGVRWIWPGDDGIAHANDDVLRLTIGDFNWAPQLQLRSIRAGVRAGIYPQINSTIEEFSYFMPSNEAHDQYAESVHRWRLRMRMGGHTRFNYGHAFTGWWDQYSETHPEYFALNKHGHRRPEQDVESAGANPRFTAKDRETIKICASNPGVADRLVQTWLGNGMVAKWVNACMNDLRHGFCRCEDCQSLDVVQAGEQFGDHLTDRYVHLANVVARMAQEHAPEAGASMYAYESTLQPPRNLRVEPNVLVGIVPTTLDLSELQELFDGWRDAGAKTMLLRPNYPHYYLTTVIPMGLEEQMYDAFQLAYQNGMVAADYDSLQGQWAATSIVDYILAKAMSDPSKPFKFWEEHYCAAYGPAAEEVKEYYRYWRHEVWEKRLRPDLDKIVEKGRYYNFARGVVWMLGQYYTMQDFDRTGAILREATGKALSASQRNLLDQLILSNEHSRLTYQAITTGGSEKHQHAQSLLKFREQHKDDLKLSWIPLFNAEVRYGDMAGLKAAEQLKNYPLPWIATDVAWRFRLDPDNVGLDSGWQKKEWAQIQAWDRLRTNFFWEDPYVGDPYPSESLREKLKNYDGVGWYATRITVPGEMKGREVILYFGAVDESCWVYVNGELAGEHLYKNPDDWFTPFEIRIDPHIDWTKHLQHVVVRVEDRGGSGGIWKRVWLVSKMK